MHRLSSLSIVLLLTACTTAPVPTTIDNNSNSTTRENLSQKKPTLEGKYTLEKGLIAYSDTDMSINKKINSSNLVIEKLDEDDFGFYYTTQVEERYAGKYFGIFHYKDDRYYQKVIEDDLKISLLENMELIHEEDRLKLTLQTNHGKRIIIWKKNPSMKMTKELQEAQKSYQEVCKAKFEKI